MRRLRLRVLPDELCIWQLPADAPLPAEDDCPLWTATRTRAELSIISGTGAVLPGCPFEGGWRCLAVEGPLAFELTGILASLSRPLAEARVSIFVVSTFDTDYLLIKEADLSKAVRVLGSHHTIHT